VRFHNVKVVQNSSKHLIAVSRSGEVGVVDDVTGREKERYKIPYGSEFAIKDGAKVNAGDTLATWDPHMHPVITEVAGKVKFTDFVEAVTVQHRVDEMTGLTTIEVMDDSPVPIFRCTTCCRVVPSSTSRTAPGSRLVTYSPRFRRNRLRTGI
jgi:DNA-directed RNA polymerase subunit beta'